MRGEYGWGLPQRFVVDAQALSFILLPGRLSMQDDGPRD